MQLAVNGRILDAPLGGVQRYTIELLSLFERDARVIAPSVMAHGAPGHAWEQLALPRRLGRRALWSPSNSGPLSVRNQVVTIHDVQPLDHPEWLNRRYAQWYGWLIPRLVTRVAGVIVDSQFTCDRLMLHTNIDASRVHVVPLGVSRAFAPSQDADIATMRSALGIPDGPYVLTVGTTDRRRNVERLLAAWPRVRARVPKANLVFAGGSASSRIYGVSRGRVQTAGIHHLGRIPEARLPALYSGATALIFISLYEGFGLPVLEAMACGTPVIIANAGALPETAGDAAVIVDPADTAELSGAMTRLMSDTTHHARHSELGLAHAARYPWERSARATERVLSDVLV